MQRHEIDRKIAHSCQDPAFRSRLLEHPEETLAELSGQKLRIVPLTPDRRSLLESVLTKAATDPEFRKNLETEPKDALKTAGFKLDDNKSSLADEQDVVRNECFAWTLIEYNQW